MKECILSFLNTTIKHMDAPSLQLLRAPLLKKEANKHIVSLLEQIKFREMSVFETEAVLGKRKRVYSLRESVESLLEEVSLGSNNKHRTESEGNDDEWVKDIFSRIGRINELVF